MSTAMKRMVVLFLLLALGPLSGLVLPVQAQTAPETTLVSWPVDLGAARLGASSFHFASSIAGSTFECDLDGQGFISCTSPASYPTLASGSHTFQVRATAAGLTDPTPASHTWSVSPYFQWSREVVKNVTSDLNSALALDAGGNPHLVYADITRKLTYAAWDPVAQAWVIETPAVDPGHLGDEVSLAVDAEGDPHIIYYTEDNLAGGLKYLYQDDLGWHTETIDPWTYWAEGEGARYLYPGAFNSLALDSAGNPHVSYRLREDTLSVPPNPDNWGLRYASRVGGTWVIDPVLNGSRYGDWGTSLALDSTDKPLIAYRDGASEDLMLATLESSTWTTETVDSLDNAGFYPSLRLDSAGNPHISYLSEHEGTSRHELTYTSRNGTAWQYEVVVPSVPRVPASLALDAAGNPHIVYRFTSVGPTIAPPGYATWDGTRWNAELIPNIGDASYFSTESIAVDAAGRAHISVGRPTLNYFVVEKARSGKLSATIALTDTSYPTKAEFQLCLSGGTIELIGASPSCKTAIGEGGTVEWQGLLPGSDYTLSIPDVADWIEPAAQSGLTVATGETTVVSPLTLTYTGSAAPDTTIVGGPLFNRVSHSDSTTFAFASSQSSSTLECQLDGGAWEACNEGTKTYSALANGSHTFQVRATNARYQTDASPAALTWTVDPEASWQRSVLAGNTGTSNNVSVAIDAQGRPHMAIATSADGGLRYAAWNGLSWDVQVVDGSAGSASVSLALGAAGNPAIAYSVSDIVYYAAWNGQMWQVTYVGPGGPPTLVLDAGGEPRIAFIDDMYESWSNTWKYNLRYATPDTKRFAIQTPVRWSFGGILPTDPRPPVPTAPGLALDADGHPHLAYLYSTAGWTSGNVAYAAWDGAAWNSESFAAPGGGPALGLALDSAGTPQVAFYACPPPFVPPLCHLYYGSRQGSDWVTEAIEYLLANDPATGWLSLAIDGRNRPHIAYYDAWQASALKHAVNDGTGWNLQEASDSPTGFWTGTSMAVDADGRPHIAYPDLTAGVFKYIAGEPTLLGSLRVTKAVIGVDYPTDAQFQVCLSGGSIGATPHCKTVGIGGTATWPDLQPGSDYTVSELPAGDDWPTPALQTGIAVVAGQVTEVTVTNTFQDVTPPDTTIEGAPPISSNTYTATFTFGSSQVHSTFECALDGAPFAPCTSPAPFTGLATGYHTFQVRATDAAGNTDPTPAGYAWKIDTSGGWTEVLGTGIDFSCVLRPDGSIDCWGELSDGQNLIDGDRPGPFLSSGVGDVHVCALNQDGSVSCWGNDSDGQNQAPAGFTFTQVTGGDMHTCALATDGAAVCWGADYGGAQGVGKPGPFTQISAGFYHNCAITPAGDIDCWGSTDYGQLQDQTAEVGNPFVQVSAGYKHNCALRADGTLLCWGTNTDGQLDHPPEMFTQVEAGWYHTCALRPDGSAVCWGDNAANKATAPQGSFTQVSAGAEHSCGLKPDGSVVCWGDGSRGETQPGAGPYGLYVPPPISVTKTAAAASVPETGGNIDFTYVVTNNSLSEAATIATLSDDQFGTLAGDADCQVGTVLTGEASCSFSATFAIPAGDPPGSHVNVFTAIVTDGDGRSTTATDDETVTYTDVLPNLAITKDALPDSVPETGADVEFTIVVTNSSEEAATIDSLVDSDFDLAIHCPDAVGKVLGYIETYTCTFTAWVAGDYENGISHENTATAVASDDDDNADQASAGATVTFSDVSAEIDVEAYVSIDGGATWTDEDTAPGPALLAGTLPHFRFVITNTGDVALSNVDVTDDLLGDIALDGTLAAGASAEFLKIGTWAAGQHTSTASATGSFTDGAGNTETASDSDAANYLGADPGFTVSKACQTELVWPEDPALFTVTFTNTGNVDLSITADEDLSDGATAIPAGDPFSLPMGESRSLTATVVGDFGGWTTVPNSITATSAYTDDGGHAWTDPANTQTASASCRVGTACDRTPNHADLSLTKTASDDPALAGARLVYRLDVNNAGPCGVAGVEVSDILPEAAAFVSASPGCDEQGGAVTCTLPSLAEGASASMLVTVTVDLNASGLLTNTAAVSSSAIDPDPDNNAETLETTVADLITLDPDDFSWSDPVTATPPCGDSFLGEFGNQTVTLTLDDLPTHARVTLSFDLLIIRSWDGNQGQWPPELRNMVGAPMSPDGTVGPDRWSVAAAGETMLSTTFSNWDDLGFHQAYPGWYPGGDYPARTGAAAVNSLCYDFGGYAADSMYHLTYRFEHSDPSLMLEFWAEGLQGIEDESWGLTNIRVVLHSAAESRYRLYLPIVTRQGID